MVADQMQKGIIAGKTARRIKRIAISPRLALWHKMQPPHMIPCHSSIGSFIARMYDDANRFDAGLHNLVQENMQYRTLHTIAVDQRL